MNEENIVFNSEDVQNNKVMGILAYFGILFLIPLLAAKDSQYARFHTNQGIVLFIFSVALNIIGNGISFVISVTSFGILSFVGTLITGLIGLVLFSICYCRHCKCLLRRAKETSDYRKHHSLQIINSYYSRPKAVILQDTAFLRKDDGLCQ